jgi:hypothetical protein
LFLLGKESELGAENGNITWQLHFLWEMIKDGQKTSLHKNKNKKKWPSLC